MPDLWPLFSPYVLPPLIAQGLAIVVGLASGVLYLLGLLVPVMGRSGDVWWSGLGFFYGLVLWFGGGQFQGFALVGQGVSVALLLGLGAQVLRLRWAEVPDNQKLLIPLVRRLRRWQADRQAQQQIQAEARKLAQAAKEEERAARQAEKAAQQEAKRLEQEKKRQEKEQKRQEEQAQRLAQLAEKQGGRSAQTPAQPLEAQPDSPADSQSPVSDKAGISRTAADRGAAEEVWDDEWDDDWEVAPTVAQGATAEPSPSKAMAQA